MSTPKEIPIPEDDDDYPGMSPETLAKHMNGIKFLMAYYGGKRTYIECQPKDNGAFQIGDKWLQEFDIKPGADWQIRRFKFSIQDWMVASGISKESLQTFLKWLWAYKPSDNG